MKITQILTEITKFPIKKGYLRVNLCYKIISLAELRWQNIHERHFWFFSVDEKDSHLIIGDSINLSYTGIHWLQIDENLNFEAMFNSKYLCPITESEESFLISLNIRQFYKASLNFSSMLNIVNRFLFFIQPIIDYKDGIKNSGQHLYHSSNIVIC